MGKMNLKKVKDRIKKKGNVLTLNKKREKKRELFVTFVDRNIEIE